MAMTAELRHDGRVVAGLDVGIATPPKVALIIEMLSVNAAPAVAWGSMVPKS